MGTTGGGIGSNISATEHIDKFPIVVANYLIVNSDTATAKGSTNIVAELTEELYLHFLSSAHPGRTW